MYTYAMAACSILPAALISLKIYDFFSLSATIFKCRLLKIAAIVMTVKFGTIHNYSSVEENSEA